jgi:hypothetical protein
MHGLGASRRESVEPYWPGLMFQRHKMKNFGTNCDRENSFRVGRSVGIVQCNRACWMNAMSPF